jgi:hypothetical protein
LLSQDENAVGVTQFDKNGRLPFPTLMPLDGKPLVMAVGALEAGAKPTLAVIVDKDGQRSLVTRTADGKMKTQKLSDSFKSNPTVAHDPGREPGRAGGFGRADSRMKKSRCCCKKGGDFDEEDVDPPGGALDQPWLASADVDGDGKPELLLPQKNFVRAVVLEQRARAQGFDQPAGMGFRVKDQINGAASDSRIVGATAVPKRNRIPCPRFSCSTRSTSS